MILGWLKRLRIQARFLTLFGMFIVVGSVATAFFLSLINAMNTDTLELIDTSQDLISVQQLQAEILQEQRFLDEYALSGSSEHFILYAGARQNVEEMIEVILGDEDDVELIELLTPVGLLIDENHRALDDMVEAHLAGDAETALTLAQEGIESQDSAYEDIQLQLDYFVTYDSLLFDSALIGTILRTQTAVIAAIVTLFALFVAGVISALVINDLIEPLLYLINAIYSFESSTYNKELLDTHMTRDDEVGVLVRAFDGSVNTITTGMERTQGLLTAASRFVPTNYLDFLNKRSIEDLELGDHISANMAVMFSDIRGFTTLSERMTPQENFDFVNDYLQQVSPIIQTHNGFVVKFLGDGMMAIFPYAVRDCLIAGLEKLEAVHRFNETRAKRGDAPISLGIGIHIGSMMIGMVGEIHRMQGDAFSDNVNLTSRLEGLNKVFGTNIIMSGEAIERMAQPEEFQMRSLGLVQVKGRSTPLALYDVFEADPKSMRTLKTSTRATFQSALDMYKQGDLDAARSLFAEVAEQNSDDLAAHFYIEQIDAHLANEEAWTGIVVMTKK